MNNFTNDCKHNIIEIKENSVKIDFTNINNKIDSSERERTRKSKLLTLLKKFFISFCKFSAIRALLGLVRLLLNLKLRFDKLDFKKLFKLIFHIRNARFGAFLAIMPFIYDFLTDFIFDIRNINQNNTTNNIFYENNVSEKNKSAANPMLKEKLILLMGGFIAGMVGIMVAEKGGMMNYIVLSILVRLIHSIIVVYLSKRGKATQSRFWALMSFYISSFGFLFIAYYNPGFKPILKLFSTYANFQGTEKEEILGSIFRLNLFKDKRGL